MSNDTWNKIEQTHGLFKNTSVPPKQIHSNTSKFNLLDLLDNKALLIAADFTLDNIAAHLLMVIKMLPLLGKKFLSVAFCYQAIQAHKIKNFTMSKKLLVKRWLLIWQ